MVKRNEKSLPYILAAIEQLEKNGDTFFDDKQHHNRNQPLETERQRKYNRCLC